MVLKKLLFGGIPISNPIANAHLSNSVLHFSFNFCLQITLNNLAPKQALSLRSLKTLNARSVDHDISVFKDNQRGGKNLVIMTSPRR